MIIPFELVIFKISLRVDLCQINYITNIILLIIIVILLGERLKLIIVLIPCSRIWSALKNFSLSFKFSSINKISSFLSFSIVRNMVFSYNILILLVLSLLLPIGSGEWNESMVMDVLTKYESMYPIRKINVVASFNEDEINKFLTTNSNFSNFLNDLIIYLNSTEPDMDNLNSSEPDYIEKFLRRIEDWILKHFSGATKYIMKMVLDLIVNKILDYFSDYRRELNEKIEGVKNEITKLQDLERTVAQKSQYFSQNTLFKNFPFTDVKLPTPEHPYVPFDSDIPDPKGTSNWSLFGGVFEGVSKLILGIIKPIFKLLIDEILEPFVVGILKIFVSLIPAIEYLVELLFKVLMYIICLLLKLITYLDTKLLLVELLLIYSLITIKFGQPTVALIIVTFVLLLTLNKRPYESIFAALINSLPYELSTCSSNMHGDIIGFVNSTVRVNFD